MATKKAGVEFFIKIDTNKDLIGAAGNFSANYINDATGEVTEVSTTGANFTEIQVQGSGIGVYRCPVTIPATGDYTILADNEVDHMDNLAFSVEVTAATIDDVKGLIDTLQGDVTSVKTQVDILDEAELNTISENVALVQTTVDNIQGLVNDTNAVSLLIDSDESATLSVGDTVTGGTSGATGTITGISATGVSLKDVVGTFEVAEAITEAAGTGVITEITLGSATVDTVLEFVNAINSALVDGGSSLDVLATYTDNLELMLEGKEYVDTLGVTIPAEESRGLAELYTEITANGTDIATAQASLNNLVTQITSAKEAVQGSIATSEGIITDAMATAEGLIRDDLAAIKTVVDANETTLENAGFGLSALKDLIDNIDSDVALFQTDMGTRFNTVDDTLADIDADIVAARQSIEDDIAALQLNVTGRFDNVDSAIAAIVSTTQYNGFI